MGKKTRKTQQLSETFNLAKLRSLAKGFTFSRLHFKPHYLRPHDQVKGAKGIRDYQRFTKILASSLIPPIIPLIISGNQQKNNINLFLWQTFQINMTHRSPKITKKNTKLMKESQSIISK